MFVIDGNNLLHAICKVEEDYEPINDIGLCRIVGKYLKLTGEKGELIFDGTGLIEDKISTSTAPKRLTIVSSDRRLRKAARARKATTIKSEMFWNNIQKQLSRKKIKKEPTAKRHGLTNGETKQWLEFFGL